VPALTGTIVIYLGYGLSDWAALELEVATIRASLWKAPEDRSALPARQVFLTANIFLKLNNAFGVTSKAPDWAPEIGVMFSIPTR